MSSQAPLKVISASRRIDMVATQPEKLAFLLKTKTPPQRVHTLVLWTKNPQNIISFPELAKQLKKFDQLFIHLTITGFGSTIFEPHIPKPQHIYTQLDELIEIVKSPKRIRIRFDPIMHFALPDGEHVTNLMYFGTLVEQIIKFDLREITTSWLQLYPKVVKRLQRLGMSGIKQSSQQIQEQTRFLEKIAYPENITLYGCCVPDWPASKCIDGKLFNSLHPQGLTASENRAKSQREHCGCTESWDIGWYTGCKNDCVYCYANPIISQQSYHFSQIKGT